MLDVCVGTSVGTITEPDCLGPCEPGTSVNLEGIVWHETEGVLVVNVTWRGKTYVGTLLDCTRHDWAPPRFCDSPTSDLDARTPKGRGKRGRGSSNSNSSNDLSNFTETRSSVHSKLRSNSSTNNNGNNKTSSGRRGPNTSSPTPFVPPRPDSGTKRKNRSEEEQQQSPVNGKKTKPGPVVPSASNSSLLPPPLSATPVMNNSSNGNGSPPPTSPVLLECPEPNCSKKYKNINGLKYHQSHAHGGSTDENDDKEMTSHSENEEVPSPPESVVSNKCELSNSSTKKEEPMMIDLPTPIATSVAPVTVVPEPIVPTVPVVAPPTTLISPSQPDKIVLSERILPPDAEMTNDPSLIKQSAGVLRFGLSEESAKTTTVLSVPSPTQRPMSPVNKVPQFKVKPTSALMPEAEKKDRSNVKILQQQKKKSKKSPTSSPHLNVMESNFMEQSSGREDVQSPAYSDISDDTAPVLEAETDNKSKVINCEKKSESGTAQSPHSMQHYVFPYYGNPPYLVPSVQTDNKGKELEKAIPESKPISNLEKEKKDTNVGTDYPPKLLEPHFYPYGYVPGYQYGNMGSYPVGMVAGDKEGKEDSLLKSPSPAEQNLKQAPPAHITSLPPKIKTESGKLAEKPPSQQNENHQILKESIEIKNQMPPAFIYQRQQPNQPAQQQQQSQPQQVAQQQQQQEDLRRYYLYSGDQRPRKESSSEAPMKATPPPIATKQPPAMPMKMKEKYPPESEKSAKENEKMKQEGVKPTMETQGPPPPPTSSYAYIHPSSYMQSPHYGAIPFDPMRDHSMYRNMNPMLVPGPYGNNPYLHPQLHPQIPRYHAPEDLSRSPSGPKALDLLQHHANQYYSSHKIHELQERALKSPTPKPVTPGISPPGGGAPNLPQQQPQAQQQQQQGQPQQPPSSITPQPGGVPPPSNKTPSDKDSRSPPPQRHVHTHHHTHVGLGYPIIAGQYAAPYGAAVLASQQAAAMASSVVNNYPSK